MHTLKMYLHTIFHAKNIALLLKDAEKHIRINILKYSKIILIIIGNILDFRILCLRSTRMLESLIIRLSVINL